MTRRRDARAVVVRSRSASQARASAMSSRSKLARNVGLVRRRADHAAVGAVAQARPRASSMIDLPAPVSLVITDMPRCSSRSRCSTMA